MAPPAGLEPAIFGLEVRTLSIRPRGLVSHVCICVNYVAALCFGSVTLVVPSPVEFSCVFSPRQIQTRKSFRDCSSGSSAVQPCRKLRHRLRFPRCPAAGAAALAAAAAAAAGTAGAAALAAAAAAAAAGTAAAVALGAAQLAKHPRRHPLIGGSACHLNTNRGNFGLGYGVGGGGWSRAPRRDLPTPAEDFGAEELFAGTAGGLKAFSG